MIVDTAGVVEMEHDVFAIIKNLKTIICRSRLRKASPGPQYIWTWLLRVAFQEDVSWISKSSLNQKAEDTMPTYSVIAPANCISSDAKAEIAKEVTRIHHEEAKAPSFFAQLYFQEINPGNYFLGGKKLASDQIFVCGQIRAGRSAETKNRIMLRIVDAVANATGLPSNRIWVYIVELPASLMVEFGRVLPEPGEEADWVAQLDAADRASMSDTPSA